MINPQHPDYSNTPVSPARPHFSYRALTTLPAAISIVTPFYNEGAIFHETARSVVGQSLQQWEWLIVDDSSDDPESLKILAEYENGDDVRIRVIHTCERSGPA